MCKVSVLIPAYNVEPYIRECLDSVLGQTLQEIEIICIDDHSTDQTLTILKEYKSRDPRIQVYCQEQNLGQSCGRNLALSYASGEYIYMLDADDKIVPKALEELYHICKAEHLEVAGFETYQFTEDAAFKGKAAEKTIVYQEGTVMDGRDALAYCMEQESFSLSVPTFLIERAYLDRIGLRFMEGILHEDVGYIFELVSRAARIQFLHKVYFLRRIRPQSTMTKPLTSKNIEGYLKSFLRSFELENILREAYGTDPRFWAAFKKWQRDIFGRLRQLYLASEESIYWQKGVSVSRETGRIFEILKLMSPGKAQAEDILGKETCGILQTLSPREKGTPPQVYVCGTGQYAERMVHFAGALGLVVRGILVTEKQEQALWGFPVYHVKEAPDKTVPVLLSISHYNKETYTRLLAEEGYGKVIEVNL